MSYPSDTKLPLKVMINKDTNKVLFAEANTDFMNVLLSFLAMPLVKLGYNSISHGSIISLSNSLSAMDESYFCVPGAKRMLLNPRSRLSDCCRKLKLDVTSSPPNQYYVCSDTDCPRTGDENISVYSDIATCDCGNWLNREIRVGESPCSGAFVTEPSSFVVTDDLRVAPVLTGIFQTLSDLGITDLQGAEMRTVSFGIMEIRRLLHLSLVSSTPLTDMVEENFMASFATVKAEPGIVLDHIPKERLKYSTEMVLKVFLQRSNNKFLYAEATDEFVELLFTFLTLPLGGFEFLLGGNTCFKSIDNLYKSVSKGISDECFRTEKTKNMLIDPKLPYGSNRRFLPFDVDYGDPILHYNIPYRSDETIKNTSFHEENGNNRVYFFKWSKDVYLKKHSKFIVTDDLSVSPNMSTSILILNELGVPFSDVKEMELRIGLEEAISLLKASFTSKTPLTDALVNPMLNNLPELELEPKQEP